MGTPEGRKDIFYVLYRYWPQEALDKLIWIYDFACQAEEYMLNREPLVFQHSRGFIDKFHFANHRCNSMWDINLFPLYKSTNTSIMESNNRFMNQFRAQLPYMTQTRAVDFCKFILGIRNYWINDAM